MHNRPKVLEPATTTSRLTHLELGAWRGFLRVHAALTRQLDAELEAEHGLPLTAYEVLLHLADAPDGMRRMSELADSVLLSRSGLTRLADRLEGQGLIERRACPSDARGANAAITAAGRKRFDAARVTHLRGIRKRFTGRLSQQEAAELARLWDRMLPGSA